MPPQSEGITKGELSLEQFHVSSTPTLLLKRWIFVLLLFFLLQDFLHSELFKTDE